MGALSNTSYEVLFLKPEKAFKKKPADQYPS